MLGEIRKSLLHGGHSEANHPLPVRQLFLSDLLEDFGGKIGLASMEMLPLDPDPAGGQTISCLLREAGASADFAQKFGPLAATLGRPYLSLLEPRNSSAFSVAWLTKAAGPFVLRFTDSQVRPPLACIGPQSAVAGVMLQWSEELRAQDTENGVVVSIGGWCLANIDALWVRLTLDLVEQRAAIYHARPDVHEVLSRSHVYHPLHAICSGLTAESLFADVRPGTEGCPLRIEMILAGGLVVTGPLPSWLKLDQPTVIAH